MARAFLDFSVPDNISFTINGLEFSPFIESLSLRRPLPDVSTPMAWTGEVTFITPYPESQLPASLNDLQNPGLWAMGNSPVVFKIGSQTIARLRIMEYTYDDEDEVKTGTARLGDLLTINDNDNPAKAWQELIAQGGYESFGTPWGNVISQVLSSHGIPNNLGIDFSIPVAKDKPQGSVIRWAQQILGERGYWLYVDSGSETVKAIKYPQNIQSSDVLFTRPRSGVERFKRRNSNILPKEKIVASGSTEVQVPKSGNNDSFTEAYDYDHTNRLIGQTTVSTTTEFGKTFIRTVVKKAATAINPKLFRDNYALVTAKTEEHQKSPNTNGQVAYEYTAIYEPLGISFPDLSSDISSISLAGDTTETWTVQNGLVKTREKVTRSRFRVGPSGYATVVSYRELEEYIGTVMVLGPGEPPPDSYRRVFRVWKRDNQGSQYRVSGSYYLPALSLSQIEILEGQQPPAMQSVRAEKESNTIPLKGEANFQIANTTPFVAKREDIQFQTLTSDSEAQAFAVRYGEMLFQSAYGRQFNMGLNDASEWYTSPDPFQVAVIHDGMFVLTGDSISWGEDGIEVSWDANWLGAVPAVPED